MAKYHLTAAKYRKEYNLENAINNDWSISPKVVLDLMRGCSQLRQSKVIESFFTEIFKEAKTEYTEIDGKFGNFQKLKVIE